MKTELMNDKQGINKIRNRNTTYQTFTLLEETMQLIRTLQQDMPTFTKVVTGLL